MRVLHINLAKRGTGRYGLLFGQALQHQPGLEVLSVYDRQLLDSAFLREAAGDSEYVTVRWSGENKLTALRRLASVAADFRPDVIHDSAGSYARSVPLWITLGRFARLVVTEHDPRPHLQMGLGVAERAARALMPRLAAHIVVHGPACRELLLRRGVPPERVSIVRHGHFGVFDLNTHQEIVRNERDILFFGELRPNKGFDLLPDIAARVREHCPDARFIVAGSSDGKGVHNDTWPKRVHELIERMRCLPYFEVHNRFIPDEEVGAFFRRAGITLLPYREATQSGVAMMAMSLRSTVVATRVGDLPDVICDGERGFLTDPDPGKIADLLVRLLNDEATVKRVRQGAYAFAMEQCDWRVIAQGAVQQYKQLLPPTDTPGHPIATPR